MEIKKGIQVWKHFVSKKIVFGKQSSHFFSL